MRTHMVLASAGKAAAILALAATGLAASPAGLAPAMARNRQAAVAEADHLLARASLPAGASQAASGPKVLSGPAMGTPGVSSLVIETAFWRVPEPFTVVSTWLAGHPPIGLTPAGTSSEGGPSAAATTVGFGYSAAVGPALVSAALDIGAAPLGAAATAVRVDAVVVWVDPRPWPDSAPGGRLHVTVAAGCPAGISALVGVSNPGAELTASLLPAGKPTAALVCRYNGADGPTGALPAREVDKLAHQAHLRSAAAQVLARVVDAAETSRSEVPAFGHCPADTGATAVVVFEFAGRADVDLWVPLSGCALAGNGYILAAGWTIAAQVKLYG